MKVCSICKENLEEAEFWKSGKSAGGLRSECKKCAKASFQKWKNSNIERARAKWRRSSKKYYSPERNKSKDLRKLYALTLEEYQKMVEKQDGKCLICSNKMSPPCVDHDHKTGKIRGLLCHRCNRVLGIFNDDLRLFHSAIKYLGAVEQ